MEREPGNGTDESAIRDARKLVAVVFADVVGYSRLIGLDDKGTVHRLRLLRKELIDPEIRRHGARVVNTAGDSMMIEFPSITAAVRCAIDFQRRVPEYDGDAPPDRVIRLRAGVEIADIVKDDSIDIYGDGINIAARLQAVCPAGGVCISRAVYDHVRGRLSLPFEPLGALSLKNIARPVEAFVLRLDSAAAPPATPEGRRTHRPRSLAGFALIGLLLLAVGGGAWWFRQHHHEAGAMPGPVHVSSETTGEPLSIAVLPLENLSGDPEQAYLADGIAEDLTTDLSRLAGALVIARESAFTFKGRAVDVREAGRQLGARYLVEGSVRKLGDVVRVNAQLVSTDTGAHVWAERFDEPMRDLGAGQEAIVERIGSALNVNLVNVEALRSTKSHAGNPAAFDLVMRARSTLNEPPTLAHYMIAAGLYEQALELDPESVPAMAGVASMLLHLSRDRVFVNRAAELIAKAEQRAPGSPDV
ncbi:MAG: adenylate/guanylate cyclase domain-containing protein [Acetobacteraceae bacterium]|nr:adenylate/guanylate cyclase domain-containing protein [Acetobacteraceae bacterium]